MKKQSDKDSTDKNTISDRNLSKIQAFPVLIALGLILFRIGLRACLQTE